MRSPPLSLHALSLLALSLLAILGVSCADPGLLDQRAEEFERTCVSFGERRLGDRLDRAALAASADAGVFSAELDSDDGGVMPSGAGALRKVCHPMAVDERPDAPNRIEVLDLDAILSSRAGK